jgi:hypothetical protein
MNPVAIMRCLWAAGVHLELTQDGRLFAKPADRMTGELRALCRDHKADLISFLVDAETTTKALIDTAMGACDAWGDGPEARHQMHRDCLETPPHLRADLLDHLRKSYPKDQA